MYDTNEASTRDPGSREDSRKRKSTQSAGSTSYDASVLLENIDKKVKHEAEEAVLRILHSLENCVGMDEDLKRTLKERYIAELEMFYH